MKVYDIIFLNAGKGSRFVTDKPEITKYNINILDTYPVFVQNVKTITGNNSINKSINKIYNLTSKDNFEFFNGCIEKFHLKKVETVEVSSGTGSATALYEFLVEYKSKVEHDLIICWGDSLFQVETFFDIVKNTIEENVQIKIPVKKVKSPYTEFCIVGRPGKSLIRDIRFSKTGDTTSELGFQDLSIFYFTVEALYNLLYKHEKGIKNKTTEVGLLEILKGQLFSSFEVVPIFSENAEILSFNSLEEFSSIDWKKHIRINQDWDNHNSYLDFVESQAKLKSKCVSRKVGAILVYNDRIIGTGINGTPQGHINCCDHFKNYDTKYREEHSKWSKDNEIHAEMNCILNTAKHSEIPEGCDMYSNYSPCRDCLKNLAVLKIRNFYFRYKYDGIGYDFNEMVNFAQDNQINVIQIKTF